MVDRWDREKFTVKRSIEDLKERYYAVHNALAKVFLLKRQLSCAKESGSRNTWLTLVKSNRRPRACASAFRCRS